MGLYPPGSSIKPLFATFAISNSYTNWDETIFDDGFFTNADSMATEMTSGFDIWNWKPGPDVTALANVTEIASFYAGENAITGTFAIYQVNDGTSNRLLAFDTEYMEVFDEVSSSDGNSTFKTVSYTHLTLPTILLV